MEFNQDFTLLYWVSMGAMLLSTPTCKSNRATCQKCKYHQLCKFTIEINSYLSEA